jgi:RNA polymerase sigma-70 factor, ECF subfamily
VDRGLTDGGGDEILDGVLSRLNEDRTDQDAWAHLYRLMWPYVVAVTGRVLQGAYAASEDAAQEVFFRLLRYGDFNRLRQPAVFRGYVRAICRHACADELRRIAEAVQSPLSSGDHLRDEASVEEALEGRVRIGQLRRDLEPLDRRITKMMLEGHTIKEIADSEGLSYGNVAVRIHRIRKRSRRNRE